MPGRNLAITLDLSFPLPDAALPSENSPYLMATPRLWRARSNGTVPQGLALALGEGEALGPTQVGLHQVPNLDAAEKIFNVLWGAGLGWDY